MKVTDYDSWVSLLNYAGLLGDLGLRDEAEKYFGEAARTAFTPYQRALALFRWSSLH